MTAFLKIREYFQGAYHEARKVTWPTKKQTINYSLLVLALTTVMTVLFAVSDYGLNLGLQELLSIK